MRISTQQVFLNNVDNLSRTNSELIKTQQQMATGKRVLQPSDDPLAASQIIKLERELARTEQFQTSIDTANRRLSLEEVTLDQLFNDSIRLKELTIQAGGGALGSQDRASLATEIDGIINQMQGLMNTKDSQGEYLFSGFQGDKQAYSFNDVTQRYEFQGDAERRFAQIGPDNRIAITDSGAQLFDPTNVLNVALDLSNGLKTIDTSTAAGKLELDTLVADTLTSLEGVQELNIQGRASIGARMNALEQQQLVNEDYSLFTQEALSSFRDLDYNEAISRLTLQQTTLEAAYASFSKISGLSLFDYIR
ncbi:flagellar hook-associated protein FlgL [Marinobacterium sedimentorum]|uniref:flagellar hook-associated protein FlgL n=1 Tax=Marinobacterium sedimentorum TaxID=2927804 RepID=UPI0020C7112C|nr:flagellar hook-associated protein FlgL [Marinobacterium sedimentorum]MCP8687551.1 flagellar hook-associated protein FlgL [Marinobacterium sedimentorum]